MTTVRNSCPELSSQWRKTESMGSLGQQPNLSTTQQVNLNPPMVLLVGTDTSCLQTQRSRINSPEDISNPSKPLVPEPCITFLKSHCIHILSCPQSLCSLNRLGAAFPFLQKAAFQWNSLFWYMIFFLLHFFCFHLCMFLFMWTGLIIFKKNRYQWYSFFTEMIIQSFRQQIFMLDTSALNHSNFLLS